MQRYAQDKKGLAARLACVPKKPWFSNKIDLCAEMRLSPTKAGLLIVVRSRELRRRNSATEMPLTAGSVTGRILTTRTLRPLSASVGDAASAHRKMNSKI